ncbi:hypothetical protein CFIMG_007382RA00001 [Ceratocystis fimbriata CBS 114723]|uniref:Uncharacterized protein n=1 Tax=Ceratocystis fimbriata CBS 114723 TaxID=1035309 RepID=A0A2C5WY23_9PEZI|nr:hypothetical protein CFIMG_007382RA00001 [Ceratocystis fimbriata CBS 114723]
MKPTISFLSLALSLLSPAQAGIIEDRNYRIATTGNMHAIFSSKQRGPLEFVDLIGFYPEMKAVNIYSALSQEEPDNDDKLSLGEAYVDLAERNNIKADDMAWISFDLKHCLETDEAVGNIRRHRGLDVDEEVRIFPDDEEWNSILDSKEYLMLLQMTTKPVQEIRLRRHVYANSIRQSLDAERIYFSIASSGDETSSEAKASSDDLATAAHSLPGSGEEEVEQEDTLEKMLAGIKEKEMTSLFKIYWEVKEILLKAESNPDPLASPSESNPDPLDSLPDAMSDSELAETDDIM